MAQRRCIYSLNLRALTISTSSSIAPSHAVNIPPSLSCSVSFESLLTSRSSLIYSGAETAWCHPRMAFHHLRQFSSSSRDESENDKEDEETEGEYSGSEGEAEADLKREYSAEEKEEEAAAIGYKVIGPLKESERVIKPYEPVFAVVQVGSHQFKVSNGDCIFVERLKFCDVNDKLILNKVLLLGSCSQTIVGRPILPDAAVHALVEEHALDAKVIIFKKKRRKNYRRKKGHRQELTKLRITDIQGIEKPESKLNAKSKKAAVAA